jgi:hypothetical protein
MQIPSAFMLAASPLSPSYCLSGSDEVRYWDSRRDWSGEADLELLLSSAAEAVPLLRRALAEAAAIGNGGAHIYTNTPRQSGRLM